MSNRLLSAMIIAVVTHCSSAPEVRCRNLSFDSGEESLQANKEPERVRSAVYRLLRAIDARDADGIAALLVRDIPVFADLKAPQERSEVEAALKNPDTMLFRLLWDTRGYRQLAKDESLECLRDLFGRQKEIDLDLYFYSGTEVEVRLDFPGRPPTGVLGHLIFYLQGNEWRLVQFF